MGFPDNHYVSESRFGYKQLGMRHSQNGFVDLQWSFTMTNTNAASGIKGETLLRDTISDHPDVIEILRTAYPHSSGIHGDNANKHWSKM